MVHHRRYRHRIVPREPWLSITPIEWPKRVIEAMERRIRDHNNLEIMLGDIKVTGSKQPITQV